jgi:hypothetical protein
MDGAYYSYTDYVAEASKITGYRLGVDFEENINALEPGDERDYFMSDTTGMTDVFDDYETIYIADAYISRLGLSSYAANAMRDKYAKLQNPVDAKAATNESLTLYFASATYYEHKNLHGTLMTFLLLECGLLAALVMLLSVGYEHHNNTAHTVYATKTGRKIMIHKLFASLSAGVISFAALTAFTLAVYFSFNSYGNIWGSSVSSGYNYIYDVLTGARPFITWQSYTVLTYLLAALGISALLTVCFGLMAFVIGVWMKNSYIGFLVFLIVNAAFIVFAIVIPGPPKYYAMLSPVWLWLKRILWFTDGGGDILWKNFEMLGVSAALVILAILCAVSILFFKKRDMA